MKLNLNPLHRSQGNGSRESLSSPKTPTTPTSTLTKLLSPRKSKVSDGVILTKLPTLFDNSSDNVIISFRKTELSDEFWLKLCDSLKTNSYLLELDVSFSGLNTKRLRLLAEALRTNTTLIKLNLEGNSIARKPFREFLEIVFSHNYSLQYLEIGAIWDPLTSSSPNHTITSSPNPHPRSYTNAPPPLYATLSPRASPWATTTTTTTSSPSTSPPATATNSSGRNRDLEGLISPRGLKSGTGVGAGAHSPKTSRANSTATVSRIPLRLVRSEAKLDKFCLTDSTELLTSCLQSNQSIQQCKSGESKALLLSNRFLKAFPMTELAAVGTKIIQLDISDNNLTTIPNEIFEVLTELRILVADNNSLVDLPDNIKKLKKLRSLSLRNNMLKNIDPVVDLIFLSELDIALNELVTLPVGIASLSRLKHLKAFGNPFDETILPKAVVDEGDSSLIYYIKMLPQS